MSVETRETDMGIGLTVLFSLVTLGGAAAMLVAPSQQGKAWGFAVAMVAAVLAVLASQAYA